MNRPAARPIASYAATIPSSDWPVSPYDWKTTGVAPRAWIASIRRG